ncbi:MAG: CopD family protein [Acetobacteraceae bacterium]|nr:CopD family protein [Acetobacteraceae bacterium]
MELLVDLFGYLSIVLHGVTLAAQSTALGSALFLVLLAQPRAWLLGAAGQRIADTTARIAVWAALAMALAAAAGLALPAAILASTLDMPVADALGAQFALAGAARIAMVLLLAAVIAAFGARAPWWLVLPLVAATLAAATFSTHAAARLTDGTALLVISAIHQFGAALWIGGIPAFLAALAQARAPATAVVVGERFSTLSIIGVACLLASAAALAVAYIGDLAGLYGTAYGVMVSAKAAMFAGLLLLGLGNFRLIRRLRRDRTQSPTRQSPTRLRRFAEVELGVGFTIFFAASSLTSVPPAVDLRDDRVTFHEIVERNWPQWPRLESPEHGELTQPALQAQLDREARLAGTKPQLAFVPGAGVIPPRNAADLAWSEYNHHWAGIFVVAIALMALLHRAGLRIAGHWPLLFLGLAGFLFWRSDPEAWPLGAISFLDSLRDVEVLQHRFVVLVLVCFALFEWRVRITGQRQGWQPLVFPLATALSSAALLTHSHAIANIKEQLLIEITHTPLALAGLAGAWARWLELRLEPGTPGQRIAGWAWPLCFLLVGLTLLIYREA